MNTAFNERVPFRLFNMPCCGFLCCWVNPRYPTHCPECGKHVLTQLRSGEHTPVVDNDAWLRVHASLSIGKAYLPAKDETCATE
jgi:hypothetical protein